MPQIPVKNCSGCTACYNACPVSAIKMLPDDEGFAFPVVDKDLCIECGKCERACPIITPPVLEDKYYGGFVAQSEDREVLDQSTSGGFIDALCKYVLEDKGGVAVGTVFGEDFMPKHIIAESYAEAKLFRGSKYAQSDLGDIFKKTEALLKDEKVVLFIGTPCQVGGLKAFLNKNYDNLITVDLVCRSIPSPKLWREYLDWQENRYNSKALEVSFRKKTYGYHSGTLRIIFENGKHYNGSNRVDYYMKSFHSDICSRNSCYDCAFKTAHRCSDFTVFDCWSPEKVVKEALSDNDKGYSNVILNSKKSADILKELKNIKLFEANPEKMLEFVGGMATESIKLKPARRVYYQDVERLGFSVAVKKHIKVSVKDKAIERLKPLRYALKKRFK